MVATTRKLRGGVIVSEDQAVVEVLSRQLHDRLQLIYYTHPNDIVLDDAQEFFIVLSPEDMVDVIKFYHSKRLPIPPIIHINEPRILQSFDHELLFPDVKIIPIPQARLSAGADVTLQLGLFTDIMKRIEAAVH
jgi:hypothetical protein